ncbi:MAG: helix-turn-helix domain-containing protein [Candidatus Gastranaerophilales bacterium]|nr:helix-turn-helix domain-containing protein [Candidatus Gastranaerophilales bacterium]
MSIQNLLTIDEIAAIFKVPKATIYGWVHYRKIPYVKVGRRLCFIEEQIRNFINNNNYKPDGF